MKKWLYPLILIGLLLPLSSQAEQMKTLGNWDVHYMALTSTFLTPEVASSYGIQRSKYNALINVSVLDSDSQQAQNVMVTGTAVNLLGTTKKLEFKEIIEGDAIYYIATLGFRDQEQYRFEINMRHGEQQQTLKFSQKMHTE